MVDRSISPPREKKKARGVGRQFSSPEFQPLLHELMNQLTIVNLCCFKIRTIATRAGYILISTEVDRMEKVITGMGKLLEPYSNALGRVKDASQNPPQLDADTTQSKNTYPLLKSCRPNRQ